MEEERCVGAWGGVLPLALPPWLAPLSLSVRFPPPPCRDISVRE